MRLYARKLNTPQHLNNLDAGEHAAYCLLPTAYRMMTIAITNGFMDQNMSHALVNNGLFSGVVPSSY